MVFRVDAVQARLLRLEEVVSELAKLARLEREALRGNVRDQWAVERGLQLGAEIVFDIGNHILTAQYGVSPQDYEDIIEQLSRQGIVDEELRARLKGLGGFRNLLFHDYLRLDPDRVAEMLMRAPRDFDDFAHAIRRWLDRDRATEGDPLLRHTHLLRASTLALAALLAAGSLQAATLIVANKSEATVSLVALPSGKLAATLPVGEGPHEVGVSPDGKLALVANYGTGPKPGSTLTVIDVPGAKVVKTIDLGEYRRPHGITWVEGRRALVTSEDSKTLLVVDVEAGKVERAVPTGQEISHMVAAAADGSRAYVANIGSGSMTAIDLKEGKTLASVPTAAGAEGIDVTPDGKQVWVTNRAANSVTVVDAATLQVLGTLESPKFPIRAKATPDGRWVLVTNAQSGDMSVFSVADRKLVRRVPFEVKAAETDGRLMGDFAGSSVPIGVLIDPDGRRAYVAHANGDRISVVDLKTWKVAGSLTAGKEPDGMGYSKLDVKAGSTSGR